MRQGEVFLAGTEPEGRDPERDQNDHRDGKSRSCDVAQHHRQTNMFGRHVNQTTPGEPDLGTIIGMAGPGSAGIWEAHRPAGRKLQVKKKPPDTCLSGRRALPAKDLRCAANMPELMGEPGLLLRRLQEPIDTGRVGSDETFWRIQDMVFMLRGAAGSLNEARRSSRIESPSYISMPSPRWDLSRCALRILGATFLSLVSSCEREEGRVPAKGPTGSDGPSLISEEGRAYIWNAEHQANALKEYGFAQLASALSNRDVESLVRFFSPECRGRLPEISPGRSFRADHLFVRDEVSSEESSEFGRDQIASWFVARVGELAEAGQSELRVHAHVITLSPLKRDDPGGVWEGTGKIEVFSGQESKEQEGNERGELVFFFEFQVQAASQERLEKPGWIDSITVTRLLLGKVQEPLMHEVASERGINNALFWDNWKMPRERRGTNSGGVYLCDFNQDGRHDLFVTDMRGSRFFVGEPGGMLRDATSALGIRGQLGGGFAAFADLDGDGWDDLIHGIAHHPDGYRVYRNLNGRFFQDVTDRSNLHQFFLGADPEKARNRPPEQVLENVQVKPTGLALADYDLDGRVDLYVTRGAGGSFKSGSWIDGKSGKVANNQLLRNLGGWQFEDVTGGSPLDGGRRSTSNAVWFHANHDLRPDLYVIDEFGDGLLLLNREGGVFEGVQLNDRPTDFGSMGMTSGDINNDGHSDLYIGEMYSKAGQRVMENILPGEYNEDVVRKLKRLVDGSQLYLGQGKGKFSGVGIAMGVHAVGWAWGPCLADLNNDGWLDLYATAGFISQERGKPDG